MTFKYNFGKDDLLAWFRHSIKSSPAARHRRFRYIITWSSIYFSLALIASAYFQIWLAIVFCLGLAGLLSYFTWLAYDKQIEQALERHADDRPLRGCFGDVQLILTEAGLREITPTTDSLVKWHAVTDVVVEGEHTFIRLATGQAAVINRKSYSGPVDYERIAEVVQEFKTKNVT